MVKLLKSLLGYARNPLMQMAVKRVSGGELDYVRTLKDDQGNLVVKVTFENTACVLKCGVPDSRGRVSNQSFHEGLALENAQGVEGVGHLLKTYPSEFGYSNPILKEFISGETLRNLPGARLYSSGQQSFLSRTVSDLHEVGLAGIDLKARNIVINEKNELPYLIDLGHITSLVVKDHDFSKLTKKDLEEMEERLFG